MTSRPEPYYQRRIPRRWRSPVLLLGLVVVLALQLGWHPPWRRALAVGFGLLYLLAGIDAVRTGTAELHLDWYTFQAPRRQRPVRFWLFTLWNLALGVWLIIATWLWW